MGILEVKDVSLRLNGRQILKKLSLKVEPRTIHSILGPNASGKSSLSYALMGCCEYLPQSGQVYFAGKDITRLKVYERAKLGLTLAWQDPARFEGLTVKDYLSLGMKEKKDGYVEEALQHVLLEPKKYLNREVDKTLSGGERKRIELASVLAMRPQLAILDEPDSGIDILALDHIINLIRELKKEGATVLLITHREEVSSIADKTSLLCTGTIVKEGNTEEVGTYFKEKCIPCPTRIFPGEENDEIKGKQGE